MKTIKGCNTLIVALTFVPAVLFGFDLPGYATFHGKIIDADTLKPIEGAVVWAMWNTCRPGIGSGPSCNTGMVKEVLTDTNGEWQITGPIGNDDPSFIRSILGILVPWTGSPEIRYYKPGYFPIFYEAPGIFGFYALAYVNEAKNVEGIILNRIYTNEEWYKKEDGLLALIPVKDPERKLHELDFDFKYPKFFNRIYVPSDITQYKVVGLKQAVTPDEKRKARSLGINYLYPDADQPLLRKVLKY